MKGDLQVRAKQESDPIKKVKETGVIQLFKENAENAQVK